MEAHHSGEALVTPEAKSPPWVPYFTQVLKLGSEGP